LLDAPVSVGLLFCYTAETKGLKWVYPKGVSFGFDTGKYFFILESI
jgi:hypothetical protein